MPVGCFFFWLSSEPERAAGNHWARDSPACLTEQFSIFTTKSSTLPRAPHEKQLKALLSLSGYRSPVIDYRKIVGEFASASAVAAVIAVKFLEAGKIPEPYGHGHTRFLNGKGALIIGLGKIITAMEVFRR